MKFVISAAFQPPEHLVAIAQAADEAGYEAIASSDHAVYPETLDTPYPYTEDGTRRYDETSHFPAPCPRGRAATATQRIRFTTNVYVLPMRNPFMVQEIATAAALSNDRVTVTIGVGWSNPSSGSSVSSSSDAGAVRRDARGDEEGLERRLDRSRRVLPVRPVEADAADPEGADSDLGWRDLRLRPQARRPQRRLVLRPADDRGDPRRIRKVRAYRKELGKSEDCDVMASARTPRESTATRGSVTAV